MVDALISRKFLGQLSVGVLIVVGLAAVGMLLSLFALNHFGGIRGLETRWQSNYWSLPAWRTSLYCTLAIAWSRPKQRKWSRLKQHKKLSAYERQRIRRIRILMLLLVLFIEFSKVYLRTGSTS